MQKSIAITALLLLAPLAGAADTGWVTSAPDNAGFSAEFPVAPGPQVQSGQGFTTSMWIAKSADGNVLVLTGVTDYWADIDTDQELELDQKNFLSSVGAPPVHPSGIPTRERSVRPNPLPWSSISPPPAAGTADPAS